jgi:hypothetical protein
MFSCYMRFKTFTAAWCNKIFPGWIDAADSPGRFYYMFSCVKFCKLEKLGWSTETGARVVTVFGIIVILLRCSECIFV